MKGNPELAALPLSDEERLDHTRITLTELVNVLESSPPKATSLPAAARPAKSDNGKNTQSLFLP
jgi:hypothetical protein